MGAIFFIIANIGFAEGNVFYNAFLPELSTDQNIGRISGLGWALGYIGGGALLAINLIMLKYPEWLGFPTGYFTVQDCFLSVAFWWLIFSLPIFLFLKERSWLTESAPGPELSEEMWFYATCAIPKRGLICA
jgi:UMF1 family MFS transporter